MPGACSRSPGVRRRTYARCVIHIEWTRRRLGYVVWGSAALVVVVPELLAAWKVTERHLPFPTISRTVGHLEAVNPLWEIFPTALIVLFVYALMRIPVPAPGQTVVAAPRAAENDVPDQLHRFWLSALLCVALLVGVTVGAAHVWPDQHLYGQTEKQPNFYVAYCLLGLTFVLWVVVPTAVAVFWPDHTLPSLPNTVVNLEQWLGRRRAGAWDRIGRGAAWIVGFVLVWGMAFLLLHLTLYPFPDIARELNHDEIVCTDVLKDGKPKLVSRLPHDGDRNCAIGSSAGR